VQLRIHNSDAAFGVARSCSRSQLEAYPRAGGDNGIRRAGMSRSSSLSSLVAAVKKPLAELSNSLNSKKKCPSKKAVSSFLPEVEDELLNMILSKPPKYYERKQKKDRSEFGSEEIKKQETNSLLSLRETASGKEIKGNSPLAVEPAGLGPSDAVRANFKKDSDGNGYVKDKKVSNLAKRRAENAIATGLRPLCLTPLVTKKQPMIALPNAM